MPTRSPAATAAVVAAVVTCTVASTASAGTTTLYEWEIFGSFSDQLGAGHPFADPGDAYSIVLRFDDSDVTRNGIFLTVNSIVEASMTVNGQPVPVVAPDAIELVDDRGGFSQSVFMQIPFPNPTLANTIFMNPTEIVSPPAFGTQLEVADFLAFDGETFSRGDFQYYSGPAINFNAQGVRSIATLGDMQFRIEVVPAPASAALLAFAGVGAMRRRR